LQAALAKVTALKAPWLYEFSEDEEIEETREDSDDDDEELMSSCCYSPQH